MALRAAATLACRGGAARSLCSAGGRGVATSAARPLLASKGPDHPDIPGRHPDIWPPTPHDSPDPDIYPPAPDMPEPGSPRQGPWMALAAPGMCAPKVPAPGEVPLFVVRGPTHTAILAGRLGGAALLLKTDGGNSWLEAAASTQSLPLPGFGARRFHTGAPASQDRPSRGDVPPEVPPRQPTEAPDTLPAGSPPESQPGYTHATGAPTAHIGKVSDDIGDVPDQTEGGQRGVAPKVGPKASPGTPLDKPTEVPKPGFPGAATTQHATKMAEDADIEH